MMNPLYWLEVRVRAREKRLWMLALFLVVTLTIIGGCVLALEAIHDLSTEPLTIGETLTWSVLFCQAGLLVILAPLATAGRISQEREQRTLAALINSPASAPRIALGKLWGAWTFVIWLGLLVLPFLFVATLWGGPSWKLIVGCVGLNLLAGLVLSALSLGISGLFGRSLTAYLVTGTFLFGWIAILPLIGSLVLSLVQDQDPAFHEYIMYLTMYFNPFFPLITLTESYADLELSGLALPLVYGIGIWILLGIGSLGIAMRSLKREVY
ncbi:MAG: ABC transporter permease [Lentisphaerae bacterium]|nr:ABC transporter permease [Lentisphaerota bacterium]